MSNHDPNYVDPPSDSIEMNWEKDCRLKNYQCDKCERRAVMECEVNIYNHGDTRKGYGVYCKAHYETLFEDLIQELADPVDTTDYDEED